MEQSGGVRKSGPELRKEMLVFLFSDPTPGFLTLKSLGLGCHIVPNPVPQILSLVTAVGDSHYYYYKAVFPLLPLPLPDTVITEKSHSSVQVVSFHTKANSPRFERL